MIRYFACICFCVFLVGCINSIQLYEKNIEPQSSVQEKKIHSFLFGWINFNSTVNMWEYCPKGWQWLQVDRTSADILQSVLTVGLYTPFVVQFVCHQDAGYIPPLESDALDDESSKSVNEQSDIPLDNLELDFEEMDSPEEF